MYHTPLLGVKKVCWQHHFFVPTHLLLTLDCLLKSAVLATKPHSLASLEGKVLSYAYCHIISVDAGTPSLMSLPYLVPNGTVTAVQASAARSAAVSSALLGQHQLTASFVNLTLLLCQRLELTSNFPAEHLCQLYCILILQMGALQNFPKPGGYSVAQAHDMALRAETAAILSKLV